MRAAFSAFFCDSSGFGEAARRYLEAFRTIDGLDLSHGLILSDGGWVLEPDPWLAYFLKADPSGPADVHLIQCAAADFGRVRPQFMDAPRIGFTCWETDRLHASSLEGCRTVEHVIVPSTHNAEVLMGAGIKAVVVPFPVVIPPTYSDEIPCPDLEDLSRATFLFTSIMTWQERKNPIGLLAAYCSAFSKDDDVELAIKVSGGDPDTAIRAARQVTETILQTMALRDAPRIRLIKGRWSAAMLWAFHARADCYVSLARGEAFGLPLMDAAAMGNRVIVTGYGGQRDFLPEATTRWVDYRMAPVLQRYPHFDGRQRWADPDVLHAAALMRHEYEIGRQPKVLSDLSAFSPASVGKRLREGLRI